MSENKNLFYNLYSKSNNVITAGYTCNSAIDEVNTSFDITVNANGDSTGVITDSNGKTVANIDLSAIHSSGITQYTTETRILQPHSCYVLQGQEYGLAYAEYYYVIPKHVKDTENYEYYISCDFDIIYDNFAPMKLHIHVDADGHNSITKLVNDQLKKNNVLVSTNLCELYDNIDKMTHQYLHFISQKEGYFYYINNLRINIIFQSDKFPNSPFKIGISGIKQYMYNLIEKYHPIINIDENYEQNTYNVNCDLYQWILYNYDDAVENLSSFNEMIKFLHNAINAETESDEQYWLSNANIVIQGTVYDIDLFNEYDIDNIEIIRNIIVEIKNKLNELSEYYKEFYWLREDKHLRIPLMKYPNGAFRGIFLIPEWPTNTNEYEYASLWVNHIKSQIKLYQLVNRKRHEYVLKIVGVLASATLVKEENDFRHQNSDFNALTAENTITSLPDGFIEETHEQQNINDIDTDYLDPYRPNADIADDLLWMGNTYYSRKDDIIGLFRYMQYVNDNNLWNKVGDGYMIIGKEDDPQSQTKNLPTSILVYNPNNVPIRIKYLIFS